MERHRHITTAVTLVVLCGILALGLYAGYRSLFAPIPHTPTAQPSPACHTHSVRKGQRITSRQVTVSVFNAGTRAGLAGRTLAALAKRGFSGGEVGNANAKLRFVQVWTRHKQHAAATLVARQFGTHTLIRVTKKNLGPGVDVVVGNDFKGLQKAPRSLVVHRRQQVCSSTSAG